VRFFAPWNDLGKSFAHHVCQAGQLSKCTVDIEIDKIERPAVEVKTAFGSMRTPPTCFQTASDNGFRFFCHRIWRFFKESLRFTSFAGESY